MRRLALCFALLLAAALAQTGTSAGPGEVPRCGGFTPGLAPDRPVRAGDVVLRVSRQLAIPGDDRVTWILTLRNRTNKALGLTFSSSQYAHVVLRRRGATVYSWAWGRGFYPATWQGTLAPHETHACSLAPDELDFDSLETGRYEVLAELNLIPFDVRVRARRPLSITQG